MATYLLHIKGRVQGVGFRPFVFRLATSLELKGWVKNNSEGVMVKISGEKDKIQQFYSLLSIEKPSLAFISDLTIQIIKEGTFDGFTILKEDPSKANQLIITPDLAICDSCRKEIKEKTNRRFQYPFTTCTSCGPRFSIVHHLPYERENTCMYSFNMCSECMREYHDPTHLRFHSETNSCPDCAIQLELYSNERKLLIIPQEDIITACVDLLKEGKVLAIKGIGGFLLLCDARSNIAIKKLRERKRRPTKPLAMMYPSIDRAAKDLLIDETSKRELNSPAAPIVVVKVKTERESFIAWEQIAPGLDSVGIMLPYTPLFELIASSFSNPLIATSANVSGHAIVYDNHEALRHLSNISDYILCHNRDILIPIDDSVITFSEKYRQRIVLRRARGFAPEYHCISSEMMVNKNLLAVGADLKSTFAFTHQGNVYISQYLGDHSSYESKKSFDNTLNHLTKLLDYKPEAILTDKHPGYQSRQTGKELALAYALPQIGIQHHEAHFASVLGENNLIHSTDPILGIIWDGAGFIDEGHIGGSEFLIYKNYSFKRIYDIGFFPNLSGDKMALEPRLSALAIGYDLKEAEVLLKNKFTEEEWNIYRKLIENKSHLSNNSMGRIIDAIASMLGILDITSYEGEAAILLEAEALRANNRFELSGYDIGAFNENHFDIKRIVKQICNDIKEKKSVSHIAAQFHVTLVNLIEQVAANNQLKHIAFSGGVFQNSLLIDLIMDRLKNRYTLYFHQHLSPNDEGISFGQLMHQAISDKKLSLEKGIPKEKSLNY